MFAKAFCFFALFAILHAQLLIVPGSRYFILDDLGNALTVIGEGEDDFRLSAMPAIGSVEQQWVFQISGSMEPNIEDNYWYIRPLAWSESESLDVSNDEDSLTQWIFDWSSSRLWSLRDAGEGDVQIVNKRYEMCLQSDVLLSKYPVTLCGGPFPAPLTPGTVWTIEPVL